VASILGSRRQITIEKPIRDALGLEPGSIAIQRRVDDHLEVHFFPPEHDRPLRGILASATNRSLKPEEWDEVRAKAWADSGCES